MNTELNLFDTLSYGILGVHANTVVHNCAVMNTIFTAPGDGAFSVGADSGKYQFDVEPAISHGPDTLWTNSFYNCGISVSSVDNFHFKGIGSKMISYLIGSTAGTYGYYVHSRWYDLMDIEKNTITNIPVGIAVSQFESAAMSYSGAPGQITINGNLIQAKTSSSSTFPGSVFEGINVDNPIGAYGISTSHQVDVDTNTMYDVNNGIEVHNIGSQVATSNGNIIYMRDVTTGNTWGIHHTSCINDVTMHNNIIGTDELGTAYALVSENCVNHSVNCNFVSKVGIGIRFYNTHVGCSFKGNTMNNCGKGFVISGGAIGGQGNWYHPANNLWTATGGFTWHIPDRLQTYTEMGSLSTASGMEVSHYGITDPTKNFSSSTSPCTGTYGCVFGSTTGSGNGLVVSYFVPTFPLECAPPAKLGPTTAGNVATNGLTISAFHKQHAWNGQFNLWEAMLNDSTLADSSTVLSTFYTMTPSSRYALFTTIESLLSSGDASSAQLLLDTYGIDDLADTATDPTGVVMADSVETDTIVANYRSYYQMYIHFLQGSFNATDSATLDTLANRCPITNGAIVYKARALDNIVFGRVGAFADNCPLDSTVIDSSFVDSTYVTDSEIVDSNGYRNAGNNGTTIKNTAGIQSYSLFPNPNDGVFAIKQLMPDTEPVSAEVFDAIGSVVQRQQIFFSSAMSQVYLRNIPPGLYVLKLKDSKGCNFIFKFVVQ